MRPCPTCECFVPAAARRCPRCEAALTPIEVREEPGTERDDDGERVLVGAGALAAPLTGSGHADSNGRNGAARYAGASHAGASHAVHPTSTRKHPESGMTDPLVLAVFLGIPPGRAETPAVDETALDETAPDETAPDDADDEAEAPRARASNDSFAALLGTQTEYAESDELLPAVRPTVTEPIASPIAATAPTNDVVAVPVVAASPAARSASAPLKQRRFGNRDPFARTTTRRERVLTRLCMSLALTLALAVIVLRLALGARPELGASGAVTNGTTSTPVTEASPFVEAIREQTRSDLQAAVLTVDHLYPIWKSFAPESTTVLSRALPQFGFITRSETSQRVGELSISGTKRTFVLAEYAGPGHCAFARVIKGQPSEIIMPTVATCTALSAPQHGWTSLTN